MWSGYVGCLGKIKLDKLEGEWENRAALWRCRGPGGSHRLQNGWGVARRGPWWVRLPYASASILGCVGNLISIPPQLRNEMRFHCNSEKSRKHLLCLLLGTSGHKIGGLSQYNGSHLQSCFYEKIHVSGNARTDKLMLNEHTCIYTSTKQRGNIFSSSVEGNAKTPSHLLRRERITMSFSFRKTR